MTIAKNPIIGVFNEQDGADHAVDALQNAGFSSDQIHLLGHHHSEGFLAEIKSLFTGDTTTSDNVTNDLTHLGVSNDEASYYEHEHQAGRAIIVVQPHGHMQEENALNILQTNGGYNYAMQHRTAQSNRTNSFVNAPNTDATAASTATRQMGSTANAGTLATEEARSIKLREEQLNVNKQRTETGAVNLQKKVVEEQKSIDVPITHEEAYITRRPASEIMVDDSTPIGEGETIRMPLTDEKVNVTKNTVVTGEVSIGKRAVQETQQVADTVRREELNVEQEGQAPIHETPSDPFHTS